MSHASVPSSALGGSDDRDPASTARRIETLLKDKCPYANAFHDLEFVFADRTLTVRGTVATFYLRQVVLNLLLKQSEIDRIDDQISVRGAGS